jgi:superfamily II DNA or RNA helicase/HKD family nuclease
MSLPFGIYERLVTAGLEPALSSPELTTLLRDVDDEELPEVLARHVAAALTPHLRSLTRGEQLTFVNALPLGREELVGGTGKQLLAVGPASDPRHLASQLRPQIPLSEPALLTNATGDPSLQSELRAEIRTADRVDLLCAFVKWHGLRLLEDPLTELRTRGIRLRLLTTTYIGATDRKALDRLVNDFGADVRVNYETNSTRLHAKAWLFRRNSGFDTGYVGSSNLSRAALLDGLEWNVRLSGVHTPKLLEKFRATFDSYWADPSFVAYDPARDGDRLDQALAVAGNRARGTTSITVSGLEVRPYAHQQEILEHLDVARKIQGHHDNLVVAATGTGKTVVAALDYKRLRQQRGPLRLLFVAHRSEILEQSQRTYREVMADGSFGELLVGGHEPQRWDHVFASVQSLHAGRLDSFRPDHFDVVVVDEFHHAEASTYRRLLNHVQPAELLGLTATPERADGVDVRSFFGGRTASELRLWDALKADLLCPFHYFGISDNTDLSRLNWRRGDYDVSELERLFTADDARLRIVLHELQDKITSPGSMKALGFCVSVGHARYMADRFTKAGIPARAVSADTATVDRQEALAQLRDGTVNCLFAVDLFNEGLDLPDVDTLLLLRPTSSTTVFMQQLGRGLRRTATKPVLTVLDFIGQQRKEFRFDVRYHALTGASRSAIERSVEAGSFAYLPSGCEIVLDRVAEDVVLTNLRGQVLGTRRRAVDEIRSLGDLSLSRYLEESGREPGELYRRGSWTALRREAGFPTPPAGPDEESLLKRMVALLHIDDVARARFYEQLLRGGTRYEDLSAREQLLARMLFFTFWPSGAAYRHYQDGLDLLAQNPAVQAEAAEVVDLALSRAQHVARPLEAGLQHLPLQTHAHYSREEILAGLGNARLDGRRPSTFQSGVLWVEEANTDALLITLRKSERDYSPSTMYRDYAISGDLFHWESQSTTSLASPTGQRYLGQGEQGRHVVLFARQTKQTEWGTPAPYLCLGPAEYVEHRGERPIAITWRLRYPIPPAVLEQAKAS